MYKLNTIDHILEMPIISADAFAETESHTDAIFKTIAKNLRRIYSAYSNSIYGDQNFLIPF